MAEQKTLEQLHQEVSELVVAERLELEQQNADLLNLYSALYPRLRGLSFESLTDEEKRLDQRLIEVLGAHSRLQNSLLAHLPKLEVLRNSVIAQRQLAEQSAAAAEEVDGLTLTD